jgi:uncharacterized protein (DUF362 family)/Pyruvate/2-oxoacid:ferredoxin oxidoreductase delta subunit
MLGPFPVNKGVTTHPALIKAVVEYLQTQGPTEIIVGDNPGAMGYGENEHCAQRTGILEGAQGHYRNLTKNTIKKEVQSAFVKSLVISREVLESDLVINLPKFKTHLQTRITGAVKNMYGILVGAEKARLHTLATDPKDFSRAVVDVYKIRIPELTIMDAVVGMEGNGPSNGHLRNINRILASDNGVALDAVMAYMTGMIPQDIDYLKVAHEQDLGEIELDKIEIIGSLEPIKNFKLPFGFGSRGLLGTMINKYFYSSLAKPHLKIRENKCEVCQVCIQSCPVGAIELRKYPFVQQKICISCYCCYELCPQSAIDFTGWQKFINWIS